jgi:hypothetical protein
VVDDWEFVDEFNNARRQRLEAVGSFGEIIERIEEEMTSVTIEIEPGHPDLEGCLRPAYAFAVLPDTFDAFFNSPEGYRAQYLRGPVFGDAANRSLIDAISDRLLEIEPSPATQHEMAYGGRVDSLKGYSAKVWIYEEGFQFDAPSWDLAVETWVLAADDLESQHAG